MSSSALLHVVCDDNFGLKMGGPMLAAKFGPPGTIILQLPDIYRATELQSYRDAYLVKKLSEQSDIQRANV